MATFDLEAFVAEPTHVALELCRKVDLLEIARHYAIPVSPALRVGELREAILAELVANGVVVLPVSSDPVAGAAVGDAVVSPVRPGVERVEQPQLCSPAALFEEAEEKSPGLGLRSPRDARVDMRIARLKHEREKEKREFHLKREIELRRIEFQEFQERLSALLKSYVTLVAHSLSFSLVSCLWVCRLTVIGVFPVAVRDQFPIDGVEFIMGNDLAGGKVYPSPEVVTRPILSSDVDELAEKHPDVFSVSVLTRAQSKMAREQMRPRVDELGGTQRPSLTVRSQIAAPLCLPCLQVTR
uniref:Uncharacterized protein n=1 Tax=Knipowitschia caucasica TaxID=637954 RepID=A0AAV2LEV5_KNICA